MFNLFTVARKCRIGEFMTKKIISHRVEKRISTILLIRQELCRYSFTKTEEKRNVSKKSWGVRVQTFVGTTDAGQRRRPVLERRHATRSVLTQTGNVIVQGQIIHVFKY